MKIRTYKEVITLVILETENLTKIYGDMIVLNNINLKIENNRIIGLLGPNGSGKTTLIKLINELITPTTGSIKIKGEKISLETKQLVAYLPERSYLDTTLKVSEAINMFSDFFLDFSSEDAKHILKIFEIPINKRLGQLSKGQKGKVMLALILARKVDLYILDEPLDGIDPASRDFIMKVIKKYIKPNSTVMISTHQISDIEDQLDYAILLKKGEVIAYDSIANLNNQHQMTLGQYFKEVFKYDEEII